MSRTLAPKSLAQSALLSAWIVACSPAPSDGGVRLDGRRIGGDQPAVDAAVVDVRALDVRALDRRLARDRAVPGLDAQALDAGTRASDAGVVWESYLACLQSAPILLGSCFDDARGRAASAGFSSYRFTRAVAQVDSQGAVPESRPGLSYLFCLPDGGLYDCLGIDYYWSGVTTQISLTRVRRVTDAHPRQRLLGGYPNSQEIINSYLSTSGCDLGAAGEANLNLYADLQGDRARVVAANDSLILSDPALEVVENHCVP